MRMARMISTLPLIRVLDITDSILLRNIVVDVLTWLKVGPGNPESSKLKSRLLLWHEIGCSPSLNQHPFRINSVDGTGLIRLGPQSAAQV